MGVPGGGGAVMEGGNGGLWGMEKWGRRGGFGGAGGDLGVQGGMGVQGTE